MANLKHTNAANKWNELTGNAYHDNDSQGFNKLTSNGYHSIVMVLRPITG